MQAYNKHGVYKTKEDIEIKKLVLCSSFESTFPTVITILIPKDSVIVHARKYENYNIIQYDNNLYIDDSKTKKEIPNTLLRTNQMILTSTRYFEDIVYNFDYPDLYFTTNTDIIPNTIIMEDVETDIDITYGSGLYFSLKI